MEHRRIGSLEVSAVGLGCNNFGYRLGSRETAAVVHAALDAGVTFFDTADNYGGGASEKYLGRALKGHRESVAIATKFGMPVGRKPGGASPDYVRRACEESLGALHGLVQSGNVREIGCSTFTAGQLREAREAARSGAAFASVQNGYNLLFREPEREVLAECERLGMAFIPSGPLAGGRLTGKYRRGWPLPRGTRLVPEKGSAEPGIPGLDLATIEALAELAEARGHTLLELAISWLLSRRVVASVIAGAMTADQVTANVAASGWPLTEAELADVDRAAPRR